MPKQKPSPSPPLRRSSRVNIQIPVTIAGTTRSGEPFSEETFLVTVSKFGARLKTQLRLEIGMQVKIRTKRRPQWALFRVVWTGAENTPRAGEIGVEYVEVSDLLGLAFPE